MSGQKEPSPPACFVSEGPVVNMLRRIVGRTDQPARAQTHVLGSESERSATDSDFLRLTRKTKAQQQMTRASISAYMAYDTAFLAQYTNVTLDVLEEHVKFYVKGRQTFRAAQRKLRISQTHEERSAEAESLTADVLYVKSWAKYFMEATETGVI